MYDSEILPKKHCIVSGTRTTGRLHLGNYQGALKNWIELQANPQNNCFFFAADWHALTTDYEHPGRIPENTQEIILDFLGAGLDPRQSTIFVQSHVPEHAELYLLLSMITPLGWLERVPTYKDQKQKLKDKHLSTHGFLGYPVLQAADVLLYKADGIPVGEDQVSHIELIRELVRHFNHLYPGNPPLFPEPRPLLTKSSKMPGLDGQKMSKSYNNTIELREEPLSVERKIKTMPTDPARVRRSDPGEPEKCPVWRFHQLYSSTEVQEWVQLGCRSASIGCLDCKRPVIDAILAEQAPIRARAEEYRTNPDLIHATLKEGAEKARTIAAETLTAVRQSMALDNSFGTSSLNE